MRTFDQGIEAFVREPRAGIFRRAQHDLLVAALDKDGCQFVGQGLAARDGEQLLLLFGPRALDQRSDIELLGLRKNRRRYLDGIVAGKQAQYLYGATVWVPAGAKAVRARIVRSSQPAARRHRRSGQLLLRNTDP